MQDWIKTSLGRLRLVALMEGVSFLVILFVTMPLKYAYQMPEPNYFFGSLHGFLFILYVYIVGRQALLRKWSFTKTGLALVASVIPFGTFWADKKLFKPEAAGIEENGG